MDRNRTATLIVDGSGDEHQVRAVTPEDVEAAIAEVASRRDVSITVELDDSDERLLIAVDGHVAFLGLERPDGLLQFAVHAENQGAEEVLIGGQSTRIDRRNLVAVSTAALIAGEWFVQGEHSRYGWWERQ
jgi:hypothetical protein